jgi:glutamate racemase
MDSGVGGLPYLETIRALMPGEAFVYLADRAGFPYGTKTAAEIVDLVLDRVARLVDAFSPKALVIACNTASQAALQAVRAAHPGLPIVGTVPAVKPAALRTRSGIIGVMATEKAVGDPYLDELVTRHAGGVTVLREPAQDLVAFVEKSLIGATPAERRRAVAAHVGRLVAAGADEIVLACTHFLHVAADIEAAAAELGSSLGGVRVEAVDSRDGVAKRLLSLLYPDGRPAAQAGAADADGVLLLSGPPPFEKAYAAFALRYLLAGPFSLEARA